MRAPISAAISDVVEDEVRKAWEEIDRKAKDERRP
jgi:hypothetical protein